MGVVGIIANPSAGKDIRRLVAHASTFDNQEKVNIVRRVLLGLGDGGIDEVLFMPDAFGIVPRALHHLQGAPTVSPLHLDPLFTAADSTAAATLLRQREVGCIVTLGGDGTNRAVAKGCGQVPLLAISTGTNNVFPQFLEGTIAGLAAGAVASGVVDGAIATHPTPCLEVLRDGHPADLALVDVAVCGGEFVGSRAVWDAGVIRQIVSTGARPDVVGLSSVGGFLPGLQLEPGEGLALEIGDGGVRILAPIAPGLMRPINVASHRRLRVGDRIEISTSNGVLALDGEREFALRRGERIQIRLSDTGPRVVDVRVALRQAVARGLFGQASEDQAERQRAAVAG